MNKKIFLPVMAFALTLASCDMDKEPYDAIPDSEALQTPTDFANMRVGLYDGLRSCIGSESFYNAPDVQCDGFNAVAGYSGAQNWMYDWTFTTTLGAASTVYGNCQAIIARSNFLIDGYNKCDMSNPNIFTANDIAQVKVIKGEAFFMRAFSLFELAQYFCADYDENNADEKNSGVSYRLDYYPSSNSSSYPARKTLRETYKQITDDLDSAALYINKPGEQSAFYVTVDAIKAIKARVALAMDDYETAEQMAEKVINSNTYTLANSTERMEELWWNDFDTESIFKLAVKRPTESAGQTGAIFLPYTEGSSPDYIPTKTLVDLYDDADYRKDVFFMDLTITTNTGTSGTVKVLNKYTEQAKPCYTGDEYSRFMIEPKVVRISEMYLIAAEAYAMDGNTSRGAYFLNELMKKRIDGYQGQSYSGQSALMSAIRDERTREFVGEGMRLFDLKRWHLGMERGEPQQENLCNAPGATTTELSVNANNARFIWPIPQHEIDANPQVKQNPGY